MIGRPERIINLSGPDVACFEGQEMRFRLTYKGPLQSMQRDANDMQSDPGAALIHSIRQDFHKQLKTLWETNRFLRETTAYPPLFAGKGRSPNDFFSISPSPDQLVPVKDIVADMHKENGYRFVPLVREDWELLCDLDILFLRKDFTGGPITAGDLDNRVKALIDALRKPRNANELSGNVTPKVGEDPFFVLMEDDKNVTSLSVETDTLFDDSTDQRQVELVITVTIRPYHTTNFNLGFA
jgi:hypothetical protein